MCTHCICKHFLVYLISLKKITEDAQLTAIWQIRQKQNSKNRLMRWRVDVKVHFVNRCPGVRVTVLLVFILRLWTVSVGALSHRRVYSKARRTSFNWIIMTVFSVIIHCCFWTLLIQNSVKVCGRQMWWTTEDVFKSTSVPATIQPTIEHNTSRRGNRGVSVYFLSYNKYFFSN